VSDVCLGSVVRVAWPSCGSTGRNRGSRTSARANFQELGPGSPRSGQTDRERTTPACRDRGDAAAMARRLHFMLDCPAELAWNLQREMAMAPAPKCLV